MTMPVTAKTSYDATELLASGARTVGTGSGDAVYLPGFNAGVAAMAFTLDVTAASTDNADTLDVFVQTKADGANWLDVVHFTQCLGDGGALRYYAKIERSTAVTEFENGAALGATAGRDIFGDQWRARWAIVDADVDASFTFSVYACPM